MITKMCLGTPELSTPVDNNQQILLEETNPLTGNIGYWQLSTKGLIDHLNVIHNENEILKEMLVECGYVICAKCGQFIHNDEAVWIKNERIHICEDCKEQEE